MAGEFPLGDLPVVVLTAGQRMALGSTPFDDKPIAVEEAVIADQATLALLSSRGEQRLIWESGHQMHLDSPEAVTAAVEDVLQITQ